MTVRNDPYFGPSPRCNRAGRSDAPPRRMRWSTTSQARTRTISTTGIAKPRDRLEMGLITGMHCRRSPTRNVSM